MEEADQYPENLAKKLLFCDMDASSSSILSFQKNIEREGNIFSLTKNGWNYNTDSQTERYQKIPRGTKRYTIVQNGIKWYTMVHIGTLVSLHSL